MDGGWIEQYGYWAVLVGGILEGERVFVAAGYGLSQEYLRPLPTFLAAVAGGTLGDLAYYTLGRIYGARLIRAVPFLRRLRARAVLLLRRWGRATAFVTRFAYGLRIVLPLSIGAARLSWPVFLLFNLLGSVAFAATYLTLGYLFGETLEEVLGRLRGYEGRILLGLALAGAVFWAVREWRLVRSTEPGEPDVDE
jgi:membrane protein DedA with SNARE-associated domain